MRKGPAGIQFGVQGMTTLRQLGITQMVAIFMVGTGFDPALCQQNHEVFHLSAGPKVGQSPSPRLNLNKILK